MICSIIASRVKQTGMANRKWQIAPFNEKDFVYLSTKNISFPKGLTQKLIPKYIGPYKVLKDFGNQSFWIELPSHLKRRGVHDVFHSSLLRIHAPNDDHLFPGWMDTQLGDELDTEKEWAIELIWSHTRLVEESIFEIEWKSGDVMWMPYYQIRHLPKLNDYFDLIGVKDVSGLPAGKGRPPWEDPQIFLGALSLSPFCPIQSLITTIALSFPQQWQWLIDYIPSTTSRLYNHPNDVYLPGDLAMFLIT